MNNHWSHDFLISELDKLGYELVDNSFQKYSKKFIVKDKDGYYYLVLLSNLMKLHNPSKFHKSNPYTIQNIKLWCEFNKRPFKLLDNQEFIDAFHKLKWQCLKESCNEIFEMNWADTSSFRGCGFCHGLQVGISNCLATKNPELAKQWHPVLNDNLTPWDVTSFSNEEVWWLCPECRYEWSSIISNRSSGRDCPKCSISKGEKRIIKWLDLNNIFYYREFVFDNLLSDLGNSLRYDFAIFNNKEKTKLNMLIEYDGKQHYEWVKGFYTKEDFIKIQYHDKLKNEYCKNNNIKLLRIPYWDYDNIENILDDIISCKGGEINI